MATLVLTTVGGAIGGPIGAALGGMVGRAVDGAVLLRPPARQGPRLTDLKVQTSAYGTQIPRVFGTIRVAGCVIWSTDLIESRTGTRGGKGQPGTTTYSYAASFAVALSTRPIAGVGRIWAEGKLLRGAAGDWKVPTGFRLHHGDEAQRPDPLIAALETDAPAHRGIAYAVFENLPLGDFGNRIPSLTFEVIGDARTPTIGAVASALGEGVLVGEGPAVPLHGYAASGDSVAGAIDALATIAGAWLVPDGAAMRLRDRVGDVATLDADATVSEARRPIETVPRRLSLSCYDPDRDYQIGVQQALRPGGAGWRDEAIDVAAAMPAAQARGVAQAAIRRAEQGRVSRRVTLDTTALAIAPGAAVRVSGSDTVWRVTRAGVEGHGVTLDLTPVGAVAVDLPADAGRANAAVDVVAARTLLVAAELPPLDDTGGASIRVAVFAGGDAAGWRNAMLSSSHDDGATWRAAGVTAAPAILGRLENPLAIGSGRMIDTQAVVEVLLPHDAATLMSVTNAALDRGANLALIDDELVQFRDAVQIAPRRWRLSTLLRGRRGTAMAEHAPGAWFALVEAESVATLALPGARIGAPVRVVAQGAGDAEPVAAQAMVTGVSLAPPPPVRLHAVALPDGGVEARWVRQSRLGWRWDDGGDVPIGEEREAYAVSITGNGMTRQFATDAPWVRVPPDLLGGGPWRLTVRQQGTLAASAVAERTI